MLIGGLRRKDNVKTVTQVPVVGDIPLLGFLFRYTSTSVVNRELIVLLSPRLFRESRLSDENQKLLSEMDCVDKQSQTDLEGRVHAMARDVEEGNVAGIRRRLGDLRRRLRNGR